MLAFLRGKASVRKRRLFAVACCHHLWPLFTDPRVRHAVETAELWADGMASPEELASHRAAVRRALEEARLRALREADRAGITWSTLKFHFDNREGAFAAVAEAMSAQTAHANMLGGHLSERAVWGAMLSVIPAIELGPLRPVDGFQEEYLVGARLVQAALLRDLFGNPFRVVSVNPIWLLRGSGRPWERGPVAELAQNIYDKRTFERLPLLADSLEEAGCHDEILLQHCRQRDQIHVRGCWLLDRLLGKT
jgi:hypothetical protein